MNRVIYTVGHYIGDSGFGFVELSDMTTIAYVRRGSKIFSRRLDECNVTDMALLDGYRKNCKEVTYTEFMDHIYGKHE